MIELQKSYKKTVFKIFRGLFSDKVRQKPAVYNIQDFQIQRLANLSLSTNVMSGPRIWFRSTVCRDNSYHSLGTYVHFLKS